VHSLFSCYKEEEDECILVNVDGFPVVADPLCFVQVQVRVQATNR
jgi:hypothetical protein